MSLRNILASEGFSLQSSEDEDLSGGLYSQMFWKSAQPYKKRLEELATWLKAQTGVWWDVSSSNSYGPTWFNSGGAQITFWVYPKSSGIRPKSARFYLSVAAKERSFGIERSSVENWLFGTSYLDTGHTRTRGRAGSPPPLAELQEFIQKNVPDLQASFSLHPNSAAPSKSPQETVKNLMVQSRTYMELELDEPGFLTYATREHGDVGGERPGQEDILHAKNLLKMIREKVPDLARASWEAVDEWVYLNFEF